MPSGTPCIIIIIIISHILDAFIAHVVIHLLATRDVYFSANFTIKGGNDVKIAQGPAINKDKRLPLVA